MQTAYGVVDARMEVDLLTISETPRAAMVNWLIARCGVAMTQAATDQWIRSIWERHAVYSGVHVGVLSVTTTGVFNTVAHPINITARGEVRP